jgi:hypothetical protein
MATTAIRFWQLPDRSTNSVFSLIFFPKNGVAESVSPCGEVHFHACLLSCEEENRNLAFVVRVLELMILISLAEKEKKTNISTLADVVGV